MKSGPALDRLFLEAIRDGRILDLKRGELARRHTARSSKAIEFAKERLDAGLLSEKFPRISKIVILATYYYDQKGPILMVRTINVFPNSNACFHLQCPIKDCTLGFDLAPDIMGLVRKGGKSVKGSADCRGVNGSGSSVHASISYEITVSYNPANRAQGHMKAGQRVKNQFKGHTERNN